MLPIKQKTKTPFAKNYPSQDLFKSKYVFVKTNDYTIFTLIGGACVPSVITFELLG
jgi:hypothetical protein